MEPFQNTPSDLQSYISSNDFEYDENNNLNFPNHNYFGAPQFEYNSDQNYNNPYNSNNIAKNSYFNNQDTSNIQQQLDDN